MFPNNPTWSLHNARIAPGTATVSNGEVRIVRSGAGGSGQTVGLRASVDLPVSDSTKVFFDGKPIYRSVRYGCGDYCSEHPANIQLALEDSAGNTFYLRYAVNYGGAIKDYSTSNYKQFSVNAPQNGWARNVGGSIKSAWPNAVRIKEVFIFGAGWDFEGKIDNVRIEN